SVTDVCNRRKDRRVRFRDIKVPPALGIPSTELRHELMPDPPSVVGAFDDMNPARLVAAIGVVVASKEIADVVERKMLRIAQTRRIEFESAAVRPAAKNGA